MERCLMLFWIVLGMERCLMLFAALGQRGSAKQH
jgi:hypothetical protein